MWQSPSIWCKVPTTCGKSFSILIIVNIDVQIVFGASLSEPHVDEWYGSGCFMCMYACVQLYTVCDNITLSFRFVFVYMERSNHLNGRSVSFVCLTAFWQNGGKTIA